MEGIFGIFAAKQFVLFAFEPVVVHEEVLQLLDEMFGKIAEFFDVGVQVCCLYDGDEAVVANASIPIRRSSRSRKSFPPAWTFPTTSAFFPAPSPATAIPSTFSSSWTNPPSPAASCLPVSSASSVASSSTAKNAEFVAAAPGGFDDDLKHVVFFDGLKPGWVCKRLRCLFMLRHPVSFVVKRLSCEMGRRSRKVALG